MGRLLVNIIAMLFNFLPTSLFTKKANGNHRSGEVHKYVLCEIYI